LFFCAQDRLPSLAIGRFLPPCQERIVHGASLILGCDVWEHSYYIDYRNACPKYPEAFVDNMINWEYVAELYGAATS